MTEIKTNVNQLYDEKQKIAELEANEDFKKLKEELNKGNNFIDYFLVMGLEPEIYKNNWLFEEDFEEIQQKHQNDIKPKILSAFPHFEKITTSFSESILNHCFPNGYQLVKSSEPIKPNVFSFILDNNFFNINYPQKYLSCLISYENVMQYKILAEASKNENIETPKENENNIENSNSLQVKDPTIYIPKCILVISLYPFFGEMEKIITEIYKYSLNQVNFMEKSEQIQIQNKKNKKSAKDAKIETLVTKEINLNEPIEKMIENLLIELPVPPRGGYTINYFLNGEERKIKQNEMNKVPLVGVNLKRVCIDFDAKDIITIYNYLFLEYRILFFSKNIEYLNSYIYGFLSLLYPFQYQYQIVTILPKENFETLESITPFIAGINLPYDENFFEENNFTISDCILIVDIDQKRHLLYNGSEENKIEEFPKNYKKSLEKKLHDLISKSLKEEIKFLSLSKKQRTKHSPSIFIPNIQRAPTMSSSGSGGDERGASISFAPRSSFRIANATINNSKTIDLDGDIDDSNMELDEFNETLNNLNIDYSFNQEVNELFFNFNSVLLSDYYHYLNRDFYSSNNSPSLEALFKVEEFLKKIPPIDKEFYNKFITETQIFGDFLYLRMIPKNTKEKIRILLFDENINEKSKNGTGIFTQTKEYEFVNILNIQKPRTITPKEIEFYKNEKHQKALIEYGVIIKPDPNDENKLTFNYPIFPKLTDLLFLSDNISVYFAPEDLSESINIINEDLISKSHLGDVSIRLDDMKKYIYLCWMQMWALTFWYNEEKEQNYWFQELLRVIEVSSCYEMEIFNLLFEALNKYGKEQMVLKLYDILLKKHLNPSFQVHSIAMKIIEKNKEKNINMNDNLRKLLSNSEKSQKLKKNNFSRRTFRSRYCPNIYTENIKFYAFDTCIVCQKIINLENISLNLKEMTRDLMWTSCPECNTALLPKLTVQFGEEINKSGNMKENTSYFDTVILFSPYILKNNYSSFFGKNTGVKLDVHELMMNCNSIFWNSLWYFKLNGLEYDFMQPYYYRLEDTGYKDSISWVEIGKSYNVEEDEDSDEDENKAKSFDMSKFQITSIRITI